MDTRACMLLIVVLFCSIIEVNLANVPTTGKYSMASDVLNVILKVKANGVIKYIWEKEPRTYCDIAKPSDSKLNDETFLLFTIMPYLCVILYDASLRYISFTNDSHFNSVIDPFIVEQINNASKKEHFCLKMKENVWSTNIEENKLWISNFNEQMKDDSSCERYCGNGVVNPLCAYALWLDSFTKKASLTLSSGSTTGQPLSAFANNRKPTNTKVEEKYSNSSMKNNFYTSPTKKHEVEILTGASVLQPIAVPSHTDIASRTKIALGNAGIQHSSSKKDAQVATFPHSDLIQSQTAVWKDDKRFDKPLSVSHENVGSLHPQVNNSQNTGFVQAVNSTNSDVNNSQNTGFVQAANSTILDVNNPNKTLVQDHRTSGNDRMQKMGAPNPSMVSPDVGSTIQAGPQGILGRTSSNVQQMKKLSEGKETVTSTPPVASGTSGHEDTAEKPETNEFRGNSQNLLLQDGLKLLSKDHQQHEVTEEAGGTGKGKMKSTIPDTMIYEESGGIDEQEEKGNTVSPQHLEQSDAVSEDQINGGIDDGISDTPDNHEEQKAEDEGAIDSKGDGESIGGVNKAPDQTADTEDGGGGGGGDDDDDDDGGDDDNDDDDGGQARVSDEPRFNSESDDPGVKMNSYPKKPDYGEDDVINGEQEKGQSSVGVGLFAHDRFVDAEDSHFFAYFMTMVILCIIGYLIFHNKQKILALALEGRVRKGTRRRPSTSGYRKLDSNLEEAVTSNYSGPSVTHVIY